jgi:hypothetical protein
LVRYFGIAAALLLAGSPLAAQENVTAAAPPPAPAENIGPRELSNFSLNGTVTREAQPAAQPPASPARQPAARNAVPAGSTTDRPAPVRVAATAPNVDRPSQGPAIDPISARPTLRQGARTATAATPALTGPISVPPIPTETSPAFSPLPWIAALLALGAGAVIYFGRRRRQGRHATAGVSEFFGEVAVPRPASPAPAPRQPAKSAPEPVVRRPQPPAPPPAGAVTSSLRAASPPAGIVASSLRPWIELELEPSQAMLTDEHAAIAFDVTLYNSGSAPARDVAVEACLINAGQQQDVQLSEFYTNPGEVRDKIPAVAPMARITLKSAVRLPRAAVQEYEVEGRKLFMPMVAVNSRYRWSSGEGQSAASFLVGRAADISEKLAPLRLDQGKRGWKGLAARRYEKGIRR